ncbi:hypothetical protein ACFO5O_02485 [Geojedonia litorea]|uniref:Uncharacterized protein n=1 Tax=Geojedonia litorea TaxID=1268269 RepID=A0ABV9N3L0_9FLAO
MAKYSSLFKVEGTLGEVNFYKSEDGYHMRTKGGVSKNRILNDPAFVRTRENNSEFGSSAKSAKVLRQAIVNLVADAKDSKLSARLTTQMTLVKNADLTSVRGERSVNVGIQTPDGKAPLKGFNFNRLAILNAVLQSDFTLNTSTGEIVIADFTPSLKLQIPEGATHVSFTAGFLNLDFDSGDKDLQLSPVLNLPINGTSSTVTLTPSGVPTGSGNQLYFLKVAFFQQVNGIQYALNNGAYNALQLIDLV